MRKISMLIMSIFLIIVMVACQPQEQPAPPQQNGDPTDVGEELPNEQHEIKEDLRDRMRIVEEATVPESIREWFQQFENQEGAYIHQHPDATYVKINAGERPTGGYGIRVVDYDEEEYPRVIYIEYMVPDDEDVVTQAIAYPSVILQIDTDMAAEYEVRTTEGEELPTESTLVFATLELPEENQEIDNPVEVRGRIIAFEGAFVVRIIDDEDELIHEEHLQADAGGPYWGNFQDEIRYPVPDAEEGRLEVGEYSAKDGEYIMREQVSVRFKNTSQ
ncbi:PrcB C-terminal [Anaerovirgula multivorans]|uniref:PrcB C-terminal n=1 Tax=Anaerovirgula multivorans TaxID=312168 RepID=A0A239GE92_9FIRM|nr:Gmad2 immunoglobulin-like domain-containing protein [Anaerovirgula multivorans]SNS67078.1 PrcB C-terminal [Anaerovirgula multivorans]